MEKHSHYEPSAQALERIDAFNAIFKQVQREIDSVPGKHWKAVATQTLEESARAVGNAFRYDGVPNEGLTDELLETNGKAEDELEIAEEADEPGPKDEEEF